MAKHLKNKVDSIRRTLKNNALEVSAAVIESKILELYPNHQIDWSSDVRLEVIKSVTNDHKLSETVSAIAPMVNASPNAQPLSQLQEPEICAEEELEDEEVSTMPKAVNYALIEEGNKSSELALSKATELIQEAIESAPSDMKQNLLIQYAEREFQSAADLITFKNEIDNQIDNFLASELHQTATARNSKWDKLQRDITTNANKELAQRKEKESNFLGNLQARIAEFSGSQERG